MSTTAIRQVDNSVQIALRVQPKARRIGLTGLHDDRLKVAVNAPPEDGKANRAVIKLMAATLGIASRQIEIFRGATSRNKDLRVVGITLAEATERLLP
jgi:uncharacterized protein (TIGR00251 family)